MRTGLVLAVVAASLAAGCGARAQENGTEAQDRRVAVTVEKIHWYGHDAFRIEDAGRQIYFDPWKLPESAPKADVIFVSHSHHDHYAGEDIAKIRKEETVVVGPPDVVSHEKGRTVQVQPGKTVDMDGMKVQVVAAYNIDKAYHPRTSGGVGYVVTLKDGTTVYHAGDTDATPEMESLKVDVALLPVSGKYVMTAREAAAAANKFRPKVAIPMHWGTIIGTEADAETFRKLCQGQTIIKTVEK